MSEPDVKAQRVLKGIYAITDPNLMGGNLINMAEQAILGGITILQYRNKTVPIAQQEQEALLLCNLCKKNNVLFIINDNVAVAKKVDADGLHIGQSDINIKQARQALGNNKIIGVTCHNQIELARLAQQQGADYVAFGRFYPSQTKPTAPPAELSILYEAKKVLSIPVVAIGGISTETAEELISQGADMLGVIHGIFAQTDIQATTQQFVQLFPSSDTPQQRV